MCTPTVIRCMRHGDYVGMVITTSSGRGIEAVFHLYQWIDDRGVGALIESSGPTTTERGAIRWFDRWRENPTAFLALFGLVPVDYPPTI